MWEYKNSSVKGVLERVDNFGDQEFDYNLEILDFSANSMKAAISKYFDSGTRKLSIVINNNYLYILTIELLTENVHPDSVNSIINSVVKQIDVDIFEAKGRVLRNQIESFISRVFSKLGIEQSIKIVDAPQYISSNDSKNKEMGKADFNNDTITEDIKSKDMVMTNVVDNNDNSDSCKCSSVSNETDEVAEIIYDNAVNDIDDL